MSTEMRIESASDYLQSDHRRLDAIMERCRELAEAGQLAAAAAEFAEFRVGLTRHIRIEEELLFPEFESVSDTDPSAGPTGIMRTEHREISRLLEMLRQQFESARPNPVEMETLRSGIAALLHEHNLKEERVLYPMTDEMLEPPRLRHLVHRMREFK